MRKILRKWFALLACTAAAAFGLVLAACGVKESTVTFVTDGGTEIAPITAEIGSSFTAPDDPVKTGFRFKGWYTSSDFSGEAVEIPATMPAENVTYYAKYAQLFTLTYAANAPSGTTATGSVEEQICESGVEKALKANAFEIEGCRFKGWSTSPNGEPLTGDKIAIDENTTLYAVWNRGYANKLGNGDYLFVEGTVAYLQTQDEELVGTYDPETKLFSVENGDETIGGRLFEDNTYSCYGEHSFGVYSLIDAYTGEAVTPAVSLELFDNQVAVYNGAKGSYAYEDGSFVFTSNNETFLFRLGDDTFTKKGGEAGSYVLYGGSTALALDGYGAATLNGKTVRYAVEEGLIVIDGDSYKLEGEYYAAFNQSLQGAFTGEDGTTLVLDGYMTATLNGENFPFAAKTVKKIDGVYITVGDGAYKLEEDSFAEVGDEIGSWDQYANGRFVSAGYAYILLDGTGKADVYESQYSGNSTLKAKGTYSFNGEEWTFTPDAEYESYGTFTFILSHIGSNGSNAHIRKSAPVGTFQNDGDTLALNGYGTAVYTAGGKSAEGDYTVSGTTVTVSGAVNKTFILDTANNTFTVQAWEAGIEFYLNAVSGNREGNKRMTLDGNGNATIKRYEYDYWTDDSSWVSYATGTYELLSGTDVSDSVFKFTPSSSSSKEQEFTFILTRTPNGYFVEDASLVQTYTGKDGATLVFDGFGYVTYTAGEESYRGQADKDGDYVSLDGEYLFKLNGEAHTFIVVGVEKGEYTVYDAGLGERGEQMLTLDGEGGAVYYDGEDEVNGVYAWDAAKQEYSFTAEGLNFRFIIGEDGRYTIYITAYERAGEYLCANDFSRLTLLPYGTARFVSEMGVPENGVYTLLSDDVVRFHVDGTAATAYRYYLLNFTNATFTALLEDFVAENGVLLAYQGNKTDIVIPAGITTIAAGVFAGSNVRSVDLNEVQTVGNSAFEKCGDLIEVTGENVVTIGDSAFASCSHLETASFGVNLATIGSKAFASTSAVLVLAGDKAPAVAEDSFTTSGGYDPVVAVNSLETALRWYAAEGWGKYAGQIGYVSESEAVYYWSITEWSQSSAFLFEHGRAKLGSSLKALFRMTENEIKLYKYDASKDGKYEEISISLVSGEFVYNSKCYVLEGTQVTFKDAENNELTVAMTPALTATFNGKSVTISSTSANYTFVSEGATYTVTNTSIKGTSSASAEFAISGITYKLSFTDNSSCTLKQVGADYMFDGTPYLYVDGTRYMITTAYSVVRKTDEGFMILSQTSSGIDGIYWLTKDTEGNYTVTKETGITMTELTGSDSTVRVRVYTNASGELVLWNLALTDYETDSASRPAYDVINNYVEVKQEDGSVVYRFTAPLVAKGTAWSKWALNYTFDITLTVNDNGVPTAFTCVKTKI